jgi:Hint domain
LVGTKIMTPQGERPIECLEIGDLVQTASDSTKPVKWIGRATIRKDDNRDWESAQIPVKVARGALNGSLPHRDLYVTDAHCFYLNGILIPAINLVNGVSITKEVPSSTDELTFFHIELEDHDAICANGAPTETLRVDAGYRTYFDNFDEYISLYGAKLTTMVPFAPIVTNSSLVQELLSRYRSVIAPIYDKRQKLELIRDEIAELADRKAA